VGDDKMAQDATTPWYENALVIALAGSLVVLVGQLAGTIIPIMWGADDASDFSVSVNPPYAQFSFDGTATAKIDLTDFHECLRPYRHTVHLSARNKPKSLDVTFDDNNKRPPLHTNLTIYAPNLSSQPFSQELDIQAIGGDGRRRNCTLILEVQQSLDFSRPENSIYSVH
jgi:hypothetical protein